jgi:hypothetical protein
MSGLIAMLAAAEILGAGGHAPQYRRRLVFCALAGEPWGFMGSKRMLWELAAGGNATAGLALPRIDQACCTCGRRAALPPVLVRMLMRLACNRVTASARGDRAVDGQVKRGQCMEASCS